MKKKIKDLTLDDMPAVWNILFEMNPAFMCLFTMDKDMFEKAKSTIPNDILEQEVEINGVKTKGVRLGLYALGLNGWYVPTMLDIRKMPTNEDLVKPTENEQKFQETMEDILNEFMNGTGDEENE